MYIYIYINRLLVIVVCVYIYIGYYGLHVFSYAQESRAGHLRYFWGFLKGKISKYRKCPALLKTAGRPWVLAAFLNPLVPRGAKN